MSINKAIILGNVTKDPEIKKTQDGKEIAKFAIATNEKWKDKNTGEQKEKVEFHNVAVFGNLVSVVKNYVKKGSKIYIEGQIKTNKYEKDGVEHYATQIVLQGYNCALELLSPKSGSQHQEQEETFEEDPF